jgi:outer membrane protein TolC
VPLQLDERLDLPPIDPAGVTALLPNLADRRPDLIALQLGYRSEEEKVRIAILAQFPALVFGGTGGRDTSDVQSAGPQITMDLPIFDRSQGKIAVERATRQQLYDEFSTRLATAKAEVRGMQAEAALLASQIDTVRKQVRDLRKAAVQAEPAYRAGNIDERSYVDIVVASLAKAQELVVLDQLRLERLIALATMVGAGMPSAALPQTEPRQ